MFLMHNVAWTGESILRDISMKMESNLDVVPAIIASIKSFKRTELLNLWHYCLLNI